VKSKTRIVVESLVEFWKKHHEKRDADKGISNGNNFKRIIWIADKDELCEQAVECFREIWEQNGTKGETLRIFRTWGSKGLPDTFDEGIIVCGISKLASIIRKSRMRSDENTSEFVGFRDGLGAVIVDEAHHSAAPSYHSVIFEELGIGLERFPSKESPQGCPLLGITATPSRTERGGTSNLKSQFNGNILFPKGSNFNGEWNSWENIQSKLTKDGVLSKIIIVPLQLENKFEMDEDEHDEFISKNRFSESLLNKVGSNSTRNVKVLNEIIKWASDKNNKILFFGANLNQAVSMSNLLNKNGISSAAITGETKPGRRRDYIKRFKKDNSESRIQVLCNYAVLTTGFDAPGVNALIIARPTGSETLFQQMVGRGMRGPKFHGTPICNIITVFDNIQYLDQRIELGAERFIKDMTEIEEEDKSKLLPTFEQPILVRHHLPDIPESKQGFTEDELYEKFQVQKMGGIRFTTRHNRIIMVDSKQSNYADFIDERSGIVEYVGTGEGDQSLDPKDGDKKSGASFNRKLIDPESILLYFQKPEPNKLVFKYSLKYVSHHTVQEANKEGNQRNVIRFKLKIILCQCERCSKIASTKEEVDNLFGYKRTYDGTQEHYTRCKSCRRTIHN